jgi:hypothetical protein
VNLFRGLELCGCILSMALMLPAATRQASSSCESQAPTAQSYTWNFQHEAQELLNQVGTDAREASEHADKLEGLMTGSEADWRIEADELQSIRARVNDMGVKLCRLETIRRVTSPWEQKAIDRTAPLIVEMAHDTQSAITFLDDNRSDLFNPSYRAYGTDLFNKSTNLENSVQEFESYGKIRGEELQLEKTLGLMKRS